MPFIPHNQTEVIEMLDAIKADSIEQLFDEIPKDIARTKLENVPPGLSEMEVTRLMTERQPQLTEGGNFIGAGAYQHFIPAAVWQIVTRGEFYTAYTPYQAEASQGSLQMIYEFQTMVANLMGMEVSNASLYDGASALAEAALMAVRLKRGKAKRILVPMSINPIYRKVLEVIVKRQGIMVEDIPYNKETGHFDVSVLTDTSDDGLAAIVISQPNFFGVLEEVDGLVDRAHALGALVIAVVNPIAMAFIKEPGSWGEKGADIVCGEGQPLGVPLAGGGPYFGFMCCKQEYVRQLPGRIVGRTTDEQDRIGYTLTLQAREQHIRRAKATSNICTNQGLVMTAATIYMSMLGAQGLRKVATVSHGNAVTLRDSLQAVNGVEILFDQPMFHEFVIRLSKPVEDVLADMQAVGIQAGFSLKRYFPELGEALLVCATEMKTMQDLERYQHVLASSLGK